MTDCCFSALKDGDVVHQQNFKETFRTQKKSSEFNLYYCISLTVDDLVDVPEAEGQNAKLKVFGTDSMQIEPSLPNALGEDFRPKDHRPCRTGSMRRRSKVKEADPSIACVGPRETLKKTSDVLEGYQQADHSL